MGKSPWSFADSTQLFRLASCVSSACTALTANAGDAIIGRLRALFESRDFPSPEDLIAVEFDTLRTCGFSANKIGTIKAIAESTTAGVIPTREIAVTMDDETLINRMVGIKGIGRWTVEMLLMYSLERMDVLPADDFGVREGYRVLKSLPELPKPKELREVSKAWAPHRLLQGVPALTRYAPEIPGRDCAKTHPIGSKMPDLFEKLAPLDPPTEVMAEGAILLRGGALAYADDVLTALSEVTAQSRFRHMVTPGGFTMSVAITNCGAAGWVTDRSGYRYDRYDPETGRPWPAMPDCFFDLAVSLATRAGYPDFRPDACLINRYAPGARLSLHQDKNERDFVNPIVSVSLGLPATFHFGGLKRNDPVKRFALRHGDVAVWGGPSRLFYHGVSELKDGVHEVVGRMRMNLTFRGAL
jgi:DNA oxidative demethylase